MRRLTIRQKTIRETERKTYFILIHGSFNRIMFVLYELTHDVATVAPETLEAVLGRDRRSGRGLAALTSGLTAGVIARGGAAPLCLHLSLVG